MGMSRAEGKILMQKDLRVTYSEIRSYQRFRHGQRQGLRWSGMSGEHAYSVRAFYLPSKGCRHSNANYFGKDCGKGKETARKPILLWNVSLRNQAIAIDRAVPEFRRSLERESAQIPRSQMVEFLTSVG